MSHNVVEVAQGVNKVLPCTPYMPTVVILQPVIQGALEFFRRELTEIAADTIHALAL
jgi:hypothetical protein